MREYAVEVFPKWKTRMTDLRKLASVTEIRALTVKGLGRNPDAMTPARIANRGLKNWNG